MGSHTQLFVGYLWQHPHLHPGQKNLRFLKGVDLSDGTVRFSYVNNDCQMSPVPLQIAFNSPEIAAKLPGPFTGDKEPGEGFDLAAHPDGDNEFFVAIHDTASAASTDVNIYLQRIYFDAGGQCWQVDPRIPVNNDSGPGQRDQFMPQIATGKLEGNKVHLFFYDDRKYTQDDQQTNPPAKFEGYYAWAPLTDLNFTDPLRNQELCDNPSTCSASPPAIDFGQTYDSSFRLRDYSGIYYYSLNQSVWTSFIGLSQVDTNPDDKTLVWSSGILPPPP